MLSDTEIGATRAILTYLSADETFALADTVSQRIVKPNSLEEAVDVIVEFSTDFKQFLTRQKIKREYLICYVRDNRKREKGFEGYDLNGEKRVIVQDLLRIFDERGLGERVGAEPEQERQVDDAVCRLDIDAMALQFAQWFFAMLNDVSQQRRRLTDESTTTTSEQPRPNATFGAHHFFENCSLNLRIQDAGGNSIVETLRGANVVADKLGHFVEVERLAFNANLTGDGCRGKQEPHGLVLLQICGTLMRESVLFGVFEQSFGLVKEPNGDNWKIQVTYLKMQIATDLSSNLNSVDVPRSLAR